MPYVHLRLRGQDVHVSEVFLFFGHVFYKRSTHEFGRSAKLTFALLPSRARILQVGRART